MGKVIAMNSAKFRWGFRGYEPIAENHSANRAAVAAVPSDR